LTHTRFLHPTCATLESGNKSLFSFSTELPFFPLCPADCPIYFKGPSPVSMEAWSVVFDDDPDELGELLDLALGDANAEAAAAAGHKRRMMVAAVASMNAPGGQGPQGKKHKVDAFSWEKHVRHLFAVRLRSCLALRVALRCGLGCLRRRGGPPFLARASHAELLPLATSPLSSLSLAPDVELRPAAAKPAASGRPSRLRAHLCSCLAPSQWLPAAQVAPGAHSRSRLAEPVAFSCPSRPPSACALRARSRSCLAPGCRPLAAQVAADSLSRPWPPRPPPGRARAVPHGLRSLALCASLRPAARTAVSVLSAV
jgi:hypothetical protein